MISKKKELISSRSIAKKKEKKRKKRSEISRRKNTTSMALGPGRPGNFGEKSTPKIGRGWLRSFPRSKETLLVFTPQRTAE